MTVAQLIDALTALPNKERDVAVHIHGTISGIVDIAGVNDGSGYGGEPDQHTVYLDSEILCLFNNV